MRFVVALLVGATFPLFAAGVLGGISFFLYTTYLFLREVRKKPNNKTTAYLDRFL